MLSFICLVGLFTLMITTVFFPVVAVMTLLILTTYETTYIEIFRSTFSVAIWSQCFFSTGCIIRQWITKDEIDWIAAKPALALAVAAFISIPFSFQPGMAFLSILQILSHVFLFYFTFLYIRTSTNQKQILNIQYVLVILILVHSIYSWIINPNNEPYNLHAGLENWNFMAVILVGFIPFLLLKLKPIEISKSFLLHIGWMIVIMAMIIATHSRSGLFLLILSLLISIMYGLFDRKIVYVTGFIVGGITILVVLFEFTGMYSITGILNTVISSPRIQERAQNAVLSLMTLAKHPFTGIGFGQWETYGLWAYPDLTFSIRSEYSSFLVWISETGLIGGLAYVYFFQSLLQPKMVIESNSEIKSKKSVIRTAIWIWIIASLLYAIHLHLFTWCWLAILGGMIEQDENKSTSS